MDEATGVSTAIEKRLVWDVPLRLFHWLLVLSLALLWFSQWAGYERLTHIPEAVGLDWMMIHMWLGYWTLGLIIFRLIWGVVGPRHARFASFFPSPDRITAYLRGSSREMARPAGHNPLGALMVFLMLALVGTQAVTGLFANDDIFTYGPYSEADWLSGETIALLNSIHHALFDYILVAIAIHILAILIYALVLKQNLVGPMIHGHKAADEIPAGEAIPSSGLIRAIVVVAISTALVYGILAAAPPPAAAF